MSAYEFKCTPGNHVLDLDELPKERWLPEGWRSIAHSRDTSHHEWVLACEEHDPDRVAETAVQEILRLIEEEYGEGDLTSADAMLRAIARIVNGYLGG